MVVQRWRFSLLAASVVVAMSLPASTAAPTQGVPDPACVARCAVVRDRATADADRNLAGNEYYDRFGTNCQALAGAPNCTAMRQVCWEACAPKYINACMNACNPAFQSCCAGNARDIARSHYDACLAACPISKAPAPPPAVGAAMGGGGTPSLTTAEAVMMRVFEAWAQVPRYAEVIARITTPGGARVDAFLIEADGTVQTNTAVARPMPEFLEDRVQTGPPFSVISDVVLMQTAMAQLVPGLTDEERSVLTGRLALLDAMAPFIKDRAYTVYQAGATCGTPERLQQMRRIQLSDTLSSTCVFTPNTSVRETLETVPSDSQWVGSSEHASIRGTINGGGDFIWFDPPPPDVRTPMSVILASSRRVGAQTTRPRTQLVLPGLLVTGFGGNAEVVAELGGTGVAALVCLEGVAHVDQRTTGTVRTVRAGEAVFVLPGVGVSMPQTLADARLRALLRPTMIGSRVLGPGGEVRATPGLDGRLMVEARMVAGQPVGAAYALEVAVGGAPLGSPLLNKSAAARLADGRVFEYLDSSWGRWLVFSSPDFRTNNSAAGGIYQVTSDPGEAYRYMWEVPRAPAGARTDLRVRNAHGTLPMAVRVYR